MDFDALRDKDADELVATVDKKYSRIFEGHSEKGKRAIYRYLFSRKPKKLPPSLSNHLVNLYDPMADRSAKFPDGLRWCLNVYVGCQHSCKYCYVNGYSQDAVDSGPHPKDDFERRLMKDLQALRALEVPAAPLHMSNSTDCMQETLERRHGHSIFSLKKVLENRSRFSSVVLLTKNPKLLCSEPYLSVISSPLMKPLTMQITCSFWNDEARAFYEPQAPGVESRLQALGILAGKGLDVVLRIDPLFPWSWMPGRLHEPLPHYSIPEAQTRQDLVELIRFAKNHGAGVLVNTLKVCVSKNSERCRGWFQDLYRDAYPNRRGRVKGGAWRLPDSYQHAMLSTVRDICSQEGVGFKHCKEDVLTRK